MTTKRAGLAALMCLALEPALHVQSVYPPIKQNLLLLEKARYLAAMRKAWVEVDDLSDAKPIAACFVDHLQAGTPLTLVDRKDVTEVVLRFFTARDLDATAPAAINRTVMLSVLLLNDEILWQGGVERNTRGLDPSCQVADKFAEDLRDAMRKARAQK